MPQHPEFKDLMEVTGVCEVEEMAGKEWHWTENRKKSIIQTCLLWSEVL